MAFLFRLEAVDGTQVESASITIAVPNMRAGDSIPPGHKTLRVVRIRDDDADQPPVHVVEDLA